MQEVDSPNAAVAVARFAFRFVRSSTQPCHMSRAAWGAGNLQVLTALQRERAVAPPANPDRRLNRGIRFLCHPATREQIRRPRTGGPSTLESTMCQNSSSAVWTRLQHGLSQSVPLVIRTMVDTQMHMTAQSCVRNVVLCQ